MPRAARLRTMTAAAALAALLVVGARVAGSDMPVPRADAVARVAAGLGLTVRGAEHLRGTVADPLEPPSPRVLTHLLAGYSFALVLDGDGTGELLILNAASAAPRSADRRVPLWGVEDVASLARAIGDDDVRLLIEASSDADADARLSAVAALADHGAIALDVLAAATRDGDAAVRFTAMQHLAAAGEPAAPHLLAAFRDGADAEIRALALSALMASDPMAARSLVAAALRDPDPTVRRAAETLAAE